MLRGAHSNDFMLQQSHWPQNSFHWNSLSPNLYSDRHLHITWYEITLNLVVVHNRKPVREFVYQSIIINMPCAESWVRLIMQLTQKSINTINLNQGCTRNSIGGVELSHCSMSKKSEFPQGISAPPLHIYLHNPGNHHYDAAVIKPMPTDGHWLSAQ